MTTDALCAIRHEEQRAAAQVIGVEAVHFMDCKDGYLVPDLNLRRDIVRVIRKFKPDILVTCDPQTLFAGYGINHPDHRAAGQATMDAVFPAAGSPVFFPELLSEGYPPHMPREIWCSLTMQPNVVVDVTDTWPVKLEERFRYALAILSSSRLPRWVKFGRGLTSSPSRWIMKSVCMLAGGSPVHSSAGKVAQVRMRS